VEAEVEEAVVVVVAVVVMVPIISREMVIKLIISIMMIRINMVPTTQPLTTKTKRRGIVTEVVVVAEVLVSITMKMVALSSTTKMKRPSKVSITRTKDLRLNKTTEDVEVVDVAEATIMITLNSNTL